MSFEFEFGTVYRLMNSIVSELFLPDEMKYKDKSGLKISMELAMGLLGMWRRQLCWITSRYKIILLGFAFSLVIWSLIKSENSENSHFERSQEKPRKVKEIEDFDYKYDAVDKNNEVEYSDNGAGERNVKQSVHNYIQSHKEKIKSVNADIKDSLLISNNLEDELPRHDLQRDSVRTKQKPTRSHKNHLNGVVIQVDNSGKKWKGWHHILYSL